MNVAQDTVVVEVMVEGAADPRAVDFVAVTEEEEADCRARVGEVGVAPAATSAAEERLSTATDCGVSRMLPRTAVGERGGDDEACLLLPPAALRSGLVRLRDGLTVERASADPFLESTSSAAGGALYC